MTLGSTYQTITAGLTYGSIFLIASAGYGYLVGKLLDLKESLSIGLSIFIGLAITISAGGVLANFNLVSQEVNAGIIIIGFLAAMPLFKLIPGEFASFTKLTFSSGTSGYLISLLRISTFAIIIIHVFGAFIPNWGTWNDDWTAYFHFPKIMLETGTLIEPFNFRRMGTLGGASYIQTFFYPIVSTSALALSDNLIGLPLLWLLTKYSIRESNNHTRKLQIQSELVAMLAILIAASLYRHNHFPIMLPIAMFFGYLNIAKQFLDSPDRKSYLVLLALTGASIVTFRNNFIAFISLFSIFIIIIAHRSSIIRQGAIALTIYSLTFIICLLPWLMLSFKSSETLFFPIFSGNYNFPIVMRMPMTLGQLLSFELQIFWYSGAILIIALSLFGTLSKRYSPIILALVTASILTLYISTTQMTSMGTFNVIRYAHPYLIPCFLIIMHLMLSESSNSGFKRKIIITVSTLMITIFFITPAGREIKSMPLVKLAKNLSSLVDNSRKLAIPYNEFNNLIHQKFDDFTAYSEVQKLLPENSRVISVAAKPYYWNFSRQQINTLDMIGLASPAPGLPLLQGSEAMARYFQSLGYHYIVYTPFEIWESMYSREKWLRHLNGNDWVLTKYAPNFLIFMDYIAELETRNSSIYQSEHLRVLDLRLVR